MPRESTQPLFNTVQPGDAFLLAQILRELQGLKFSIVTGAASLANIPVAGILLEDTLIAVIAIDGDNAVLASSVFSVTAQASITSNGNIQLSLTDTTTYRLVVVWLDKSGP